MSTLSFCLLLLLSFVACSSDDELDSQNIDNTSTIEINSKEALYVENNIDYGAVLYVNEYTYVPAVNTGFTFGVDQLDFAYNQNNSLFYSPYKLKEEVLDFIQEQSNIFTDESELVSLSGEFSFEDGLMVWSGYKMTRPIIRVEDLFGINTNVITLFPYKKVLGDATVLDGEYETMLVYPDNDTVKSRIKIDYKEDGYIYITSKFSLNDAIINEVNFAPIIDNGEMFYMYNVDSEFYLFSLGLPQLQPIFSAHFFFKDAYEQ